MKRYLLFAGDRHYPDGGAEDFRGVFDTLEEAQAVQHGREWAHIAHIEEDGALRIVSTWLYGLVEWRDQTFLVEIRPAGWNGVPVP